mmetsp:Transcript_18069/g.51736  ORF Transcript_18069/g.51736 Transcript_18069/m.51736 type:complete len:405 (-) Transcript_18069:270-1484(-)
MRFPSAASTLLFVASCLLARAVYAEAAVAADAEGQAVDYTQIDLTTLTNDELVAICTDRGFELVFDLDDATEEPLVYAHEDYVDAARECLKLEAEMDAFYEENPDMLGEMEEERVRMMKEQEELEQKLKEAQDKLDKEKARQSSDSSAFVKKTKQEEATGGDETDDNDNVSNEESKKDNRKDDELTADDEVIDLDDIMNEVIEESQKTKADHPNDGTEAEPKEATSAATNESSETNSAPSSIASTGSSEADDGLIIEFKEVYAEFCEKLKQDFEMIVNIAVPKPLRGPLKEGLQKGYTIAKDASSKILVKVKSSGLYEKVTQDVIRIVDIVVPQAAREPLRKGLKTGVKIARDGAIKGADIAKRYGSALLEKGMATYKRIQQEQEERRERDQKEAAPEGATAAA